MSAGLRPAVALVLAVAGIALAAPAGAAPSSTPVRKHDVLVYGQRIHYAEAGRGPPVILLHALGADLSDWRLNIAALARRHRVIAFDTIGSGRSDKPAIDYRPSTLVDFLGGFMDALSIRRAALVGHSFNGAVAARFAIDHPERVDRLVLVAAGYGLAIPQVSDPDQLGHVPGTLKYIFPATLSDTRSLIRLAISDPTKADDPAVVAQSFAQAMQAGYLMNRIRATFVARQETLDGSLGRIHTPTLVVWGRKDGINPFPMSARFVEGVANARLAIFERSSHFPNQEEPDAFNAALEDFFSRS